MMSHLADMILAKSTDAHSLHQAEAWAKKALDVLATARKHTSAKIPTCETALAVSLFNIGTIREVLYTLLR